MNARKSETVSSLSIAVLAAIAIISIVSAIGIAVASPGLQSRLMLGPSLNKDGPAASSPPATPTVNAPAPTVNAPPAAPTPATSSSSTNIHPTLPTPSSAQERHRQEQLHIQQQLAVQPAPTPTPMERAGRLVRSVMQKLEPDRPHTVPRDGGGIELSRGQSIPHPTHITTTVGSTTVTSAAPANSAAPPSRGLTPGGNVAGRQEKKVVNQDPTKAVQQTQRGLTSVQKMNVGVAQ